MRSTINTHSALLLTLLLLAGTTQAGLSTYNDRASFDAAVSVLPVEDFEEGNIAAGHAANFPDPLDSTTNNTYFSAGDILPGLTIRTPFDNSPGPDLILEGAGTVGNPSKAIYATSPSDSLDLIFGHANAVGFDLLIASSPATVDVSVFGTSNTLLDSFPISAAVAGSFFGVVSDMGPIERINILSRSNPSAPAGGYFEGVDNIAFGAVPEPSTLALLGLSLACIGFVRGRRKTA